MTKWQEKLFEPVQLTEEGIVAVTNAHSALTAARLEFDANRAGVIRCYDEAKFDTQLSNALKHVDELLGLIAEAKKGAPHD